MAKDRALAPLLPRIIIETPGELLLRALQAGTVSTNVFLRRLHNFCLDMNWLPWSLVPKRQWPQVKLKEKRAITLEEHQKIVAAEVNPERRVFYQLCWHLGGSQGDLAKPRRQTNQQLQRPRLGKNASPHSENNTRKSHHRNSQYPKQPVM